MYAAKFDQIKPYCVTKETDKTIWLARMDRIQAMEEPET